MRNVVKIGSWGFEFRPNAYLAHTKLWVQFLAFKEKKKALKIALTIGCRSLGKEKEVCLIRVRNSFLFVLEHLQ